MIPYSARNSRSGVRPGAFWRFTDAGLWLMERAGASISANEPQGRPVAIRQTAEPDTPRLAEAMRTPPQLVASRLAAKKRCYIVELENEIACYAWATLGEEEIPELERVVCVDPDEAYVWDCYTVPRFRGRGLLAAALIVVAQSLRDLGIVRYWAVIMSSNRASERAFAKAGYRQVERMFLLRVGSLSHMWLVPSRDAEPAVQRRVRALLSQPESLLRPGPRDLH